MARRGPYAKGIAKREAILNAAVELLTRKGYTRATVVELADTVGLSMTGLLHYFGSKDELFTAVLRHMDVLNQRELDRLHEAERENAAAGGQPDSPERIVEVVRHDAGVPGLRQLVLRLSVEASDGEHPAHEYIRDRQERLQTTTAEVVKDVQGSGRLPHHLDPERVAAMLYALVDGLTMHSMHDPDLDVADHVISFWNAIGLRPPTPRSPRPEA